jgi:hypothetical protein
VRAAAQGTPWDRVAFVPPYPGIRGEEGDRDTAEVREFFARQRREGYDLALQLHGGGRNSNPFVTALGARITAGTRAAGAPALDRWLPYVYYQHEVLRCLEVVGLVGAPPVELEPRLDVTGDDRAAAAGLLPGGSPPWVALSPAPATRAAAGPRPASPRSPGSWPTGVPTSSWSAPARTTSGPPTPSRPGCRPSRSTWWALFR